MPPTTSRTSRPPPSSSEPAGPSSAERYAALLAGSTPPPGFDELPESSPSADDEWPPPFEQVVVRPPEGAHREHDAMMRRLVAEHEGFIHATLLKLRGNVVVESTKDLAQEVLVVLNQKAALGKLPEEVRGFLVWTIVYKLKNHARKGRLDVDRGGDAAEQASPDRSAEGQLIHDEDLADLADWIADLPDAQAGAIRCVLLEETAYADASEILGRPVGTVASDVSRGKKKLRERALASRRSSEPPSR